MSTALVLAAALLAPAHPGHADTPAPPEALAVTTEVSTGNDTHPYQAVAGWCQLPDDAPIGPTHGGIAVDRDGFVYFTTESENNSILKYSPDGEFVARLGGNDFRGLHSLTIHDEPDGTQALYAAFLAGDRIVKFSLDGEVLLDLPVPAESGKYDDNPGSYNPTAVAVAPDGRIYAGDGYGRKWIHVYDSDGTYLDTFGGPGGEPHQLSNPHGLAIDTRYEPARLLVADREKNRLVHFSLDGEYLGEVTTGLHRPCAMSILGTHVVIAELQGRVTILDGENNQVAHLGHNPAENLRANFGVAPADWQPGVFTAPHGVTFDADGNVYVMDWNATGRVSKLERQVPMPGTTE